MNLYGINPVKKGFIIKMNNIKSIKKNAEIASVIYGYLQAWQLPSDMESIKFLRQTSYDFIEAVGNLGFPIPVLFAWVAGLSEFFGGLLLTLGLGIRYASSFLSVTMLVAILIRHAGNPFSGKEKTLLFFFIFLLFYRWVRQVWVKSPGEETLIH